MDFHYQGRAWAFGDDIANDGGIMPLKFVLEQQYDPKILSRHVFSRLMPTLAQEAKPGDVIFGGRNFGYGNPHVQGFLGLKGLGVGLVVGSISRGPFRACINAGVPVLTGSKVVVQTGDEIEVDFKEGVVKNTSRDEHEQLEPLNALLMEIVSAGGGLAYTKQRLQSQMAS